MLNKEKFLAQVSNIAKIYLNNDKLVRDLVIVYKNLR